MLQPAYDHTDDAAGDPGISREPVSRWDERHQTGLWRYLRFLGCPADLADDLTQEALLAGLAVRGEARPNGVLGSDHGN